MISGTNLAGDHEVSRSLDYSSDGLQDDRQGSETLQLSRKRDALEKTMTSETTRKEEKKDLDS
ncbi:hypothetical protein IFR04_014602 [Cadophora malorum]|uniref:Uncharacterized protein n=1 Tax=Cadophora malorum TaxID=108018 RepID=A0A8H7T4J5_9HELO|nr:hypothetical protein IFR04_014602 [Cadophora malorum]